MASVQNKVPELAALKHMKVRELLEPGCTDMLKDFGLSVTQYMALRVSFFDRLLVATNIRRK